MNPTKLKFRGGSIFFSTERVGMNKSHLHVGSLMGSDRKYMD